MTSSDTDCIALRLELEERAFNLGFCDKLTTTLVADMLQGACHMANAMDSFLSHAPGGLHIKKELRQAICRAGARLDDYRTADKGSICDMLAEFSSEIALTAKENGIVASTGDCRGACKYNTGDSSEYRNYGW